MRNAALAVIVILVFLAGANPVVGYVLVEGSWTAVTSLPSSYDVLGAAVVDGMIYIIGYDMCERYDIGTDTWSSIAPLPVYTGSAVVACQNKVYVTGGNPTQVYDPAADFWSLAASIPETRRSFSLVNVNDALYAVGGADGNDIIERYTPIGYDESLLPTISPSTYPTASPTTAPDSFTANIFTIALTAMITVVATASLVIYHEKHKKNT